MCPPISRTCDTSPESFLCSFLVHMIITGFTEVGFSAIRRGIRDLLILATTKIWQKYSKKASVVFCFVVSLLCSRYEGCHVITFLPTNGCSLELFIPFPLLLRTNSMHVTVSSCTNHISHYICCQRSRFPRNGSLFLIGQFMERNAELE